MRVFKLGSANVNNMHCSNYPLINRYVIRCKRFKKSKQLSGTQNS